MNRINTADQAGKRGKAGLGKEASLPFYSSVMTRHIKHGRTVTRKKSETVIGMTFQKYFQFAILLK